jgi:hypothetical protein
MSIYVKFNDEGRSTEMTNVNPNSTEYVELGDDQMGKHLLKSGELITELTDEERDALFLKARIASETIGSKNMATLRLKESESLVLPDIWSSYTKAQKATVTKYRDFLRAIESQKGFPSELTWPEVPKLGV